MTDENDKKYIITGFQLQQLVGYSDLDFVCQAIQANPLEKELERFGILTGEGAERERILRSFEEGFC